MRGGDDRLNIVLVVADDHGREAVGCYGNPVVSTPAIDALAADGTRFDAAFCTTASCSSSRSVLLTGLQSHTNGTYGLTHRPHGFSMAPGVATLPAMLSAAGYRTGRIGKKHYRPEKAFPFDWDPPEWGSDAELARFRDDVWMSSRCEEFLDGSEPFFLYWCSHNPHRLATREDHPLRPDDFGNPTSDFPGDVEQRFDPEEVVVPPFLHDAPEVRAELAEYYASIARLDRGVGRLLRLLDDRGLADRTLVLYLSDNGAAFPVAKTTLYEPGMRLPLVARWPGGPRGAVRDELVSWADITPTLLEVAGADRPDDLQGRSLVPLLQAAGREPVEWPDEVFASHCLHQITGYYPMRVLRTARYKLILNLAWRLEYPTAADLWRSATWQSALRTGATLGRRTIDAYLHRPRIELYDLETDPLELHNLAGEPEHRARVDAFSTRLRDLQRRTRDPWLHKWEYE